MYTYEEVIALLEHQLKCLEGTLIQGLKALNGNAVVDLRRRVESAAFVLGEILYKIVEGDDSPVHELMRKLSDNEEYYI